MKLFTLKYEYRGSVRVEVKAETKEEAEKLGLEEADEFINGSLSLYDVSVMDERDIVDGGE